MWILFLIIALFLLFWQISQIISVIGGAPAVYAKDETIRKAFGLAELKKGQVVVDLGCGNARSLIIAAKEFKAKGVGVEISPFYYLLSKINVWLSGESKNIKTLFGNFENKRSEIKKADVIYLYSITGTIGKIEPWLFRTLRPGTKVISVEFPFENQKPVKEILDPLLFLYLQKP